MNKISIAASRVIDALISSNGRVARKYLAPDLVVTATRVCFNGKIMRGNINVRFKAGEPNYEEREFIRKCKRAKEPFPVRKIQMKFMNVKRRSAS